MEKSELDALIKESVKSELTGLPELVKAAVGAALPKEKLTAEEIVADKDTDGKFKTFGDFARAVARIRMFGIPDNRLLYKTATDKIVAPGVNAHGKATLVEGTDSAGGYASV